jgi:hypothetical protein
MAKRIGLLKRMKKNRLARVKSRKSRRSKRKGTLPNSTTKQRIEKITQSKPLRSKKELMDKADKSTKKAEKALNVAQSTASTGIAVASGVAAVSAAGGSATVGTFLTATAVAAPPFSTVAAAIAGVGIAATVGIRKAGQRKKKLLAKDEGLLLKMIERYKKKSPKFRKRETEKLLKQYEKHLQRGDKKTLAMFDGDKKRKEKTNWLAKKAKLEMKLKALYAAQYKPDSKDSKQTKKEIPLGTAIAEKRMVASIKEKQANSIDPRTSMLKLESPGKVAVTPQSLAADTIQLAVPDTTLIKLGNELQKSEEQGIGNVEETLSKVDILEDAINSSQKQSISLKDMPEKELPLALQEEVSKDIKKPLLIGSIAAVGLLATVIVIIIIHYF